MEDFEIIKEQVAKLISSGQTKQVIAYLSKALKDNQKYRNEIQLISARYSNLTQKERKGIISNEKLTQGINQINNDLLEFSDSLISKEIIGETKLNKKIPIALLFGGLLVLLIYFLGCPDKNIEATTSGFVAHLDSESLLNTSNLHRPIRFDTTSYGPIKLNGKPNKCVFMHPKDDGIGFAKFKIPEKAKWFNFIVGINEFDDYSKFGQARAKVYINNELVFDEKIKTRGKVYKQSIPIPNDTNNELRLEVDSDEGPADDKKWCDQVVWGNASFSETPLFN